MSDSMFQAAWIRMYVRSRTLHIPELILNSQICPNVSHSSLVLHAEWRKTYNTGVQSSNINTAQVLPGSLCTHFAYTAFRIVSTRLLSVTVKTMLSLLRRLDDHYKWSNCYNYDNHMIVNLPQGINFYHKSTYLCPGVYLHAYMKSVMG